MLVRAQFTTWPITAPTMIPRIRSSSLSRLGYTDFSDVKDRGYFDSIYIRTPSGALFEAAVSHDPAFLCNEPYESMGTKVMMSPQIEANKEEVMKIIGTVEG